MPRVVVRSFPFREVPTLCHTSTLSGFRQELCVWWNINCRSMGKAAKVKEHEASPELPKTVKVGGSTPSTNGSTVHPVASGSAGQAAGSAKSAQQNDMLSVLTGISTILQKGFDSLKSEVGQVSEGLDKLEEKMSKRFDDLVESDNGEGEDDSEELDQTHDQAQGQGQGQAALPKPAKRKRQDDHDLSDGEIEEIQSEVLSEASNALDNDDAIGPPVKEHVAAFVKKAFLKPLKGDNIKKFKDKFPTPANIDCLEVPRANEPIYLKLSATAKNKDKAIQDNQAVFMKVVNAMVKITDILSEHEKESDWVKEAMKVSTDAITLSASLKCDWLRARRDDIKPSLPDDFKSLASENVPLNAKNLFGDDLEGSIKTVENTNKIAKKMDSGKKKPNQGGNNNNKNSKFQQRKKKRFYNNKNNNNNSSADNKNNKREYNDKKDFRKRGSRN